MIAIEVKNLSKRFQIPIKKSGFGGALTSLFRTHRYKQIEAVNNISFQIQKGELVGFLGPNGAGKTTTLKMLSGLLYPSSGTTEILGHVPWERKKEFQKKFSMVMGQRTQLWWDLPARETFLLNQKIFEIPFQDFLERQDELIQLLELENLIDTPVKKLSLGERMKAELACALLHRPEILLLDEPTLGLDIVMQKKLRQFIIDYNQRYQATILLTSHNMDDVEELCKRVIIIDEGKLLFDGDLEQIVFTYAPDKLVSITTQKPLQRTQLETFGQILSLENNSAKITIHRNDISKHMTRLLQQISVIDLSIEELPIEDIIRKVFTKTAPPPPTLETLTKKN